MFSILFAVSLSAASGQGETPDWLLVRGKAESVGRLSYERIAEIYLPKQSCRIVEASAAAQLPAASRLVIGTPADNALVGELAQAFGLEIEAGRARIADEPYGAGTGLVLIGDDPDGGGRAILMTGLDPDGVFACFTTSIDVNRPGYVIVRGGRAIARGSLETGGASQRLDFETQKARVLRLDTDLDHLAGSPAELGPGERTLRLARGLEGYRHVLAQVVGGSGDALMNYAVWAQGAGAQAIAAARESYAESELEALVLAGYARVAAAFDEQRDPKPAFYVLYGPPGGTNAKNFGPDPIDGRPQVLFNLCALKPGLLFEAAVLHESVHTFQDHSRPGLLDRALREGVATHVAQALAPELPDHLALFWSPAELAAAKQRRAAIIDAFRATTGAPPDGELIDQFLILGKPLKSVPGAPSRCGYYVGWLAARAWCAADERRGLADLLHADSKEIFAALR